MTARVSAVNRTVLTLLGLLLVAVGGLGLALSAGLLGADRASQPVVPQALSDLAADSWWFWPAAGLACLLVAVLGFRWLAAQLQVDRVAEMDLTRDPREGMTVLDGGAIAAAVTAEASELPGVSGATAHLRDRRGPAMDLRVDLDARADVASVRDRLESEVVPHLRQALDSPDLPIVIELRPRRSTTSRNLA